MNKTYQEFILEMGASERRQIASCLYVLIQHITKMNYVPEPVKSDNQAGWAKTIREQKTGLEKILTRHRSLMAEITRERINEIYAASIGEVRTEYPKVHFPQECPFTLEQILGERLSAMAES